jgi:hypothetical protein
MLPAQLINAEAKIAPTIAMCLRCSAAATGFAKMRLAKTKAHVPKNFIAQLLFWSA